MFDIWIKLLGLSCVVVATYVFYFRKKEARYNAAQQEKNIIISNLRSELHKKQQDNLKSSDSSLDAESKKKDTEDFEKLLKAARVSISKNALVGMEQMPDAFKSAMGHFIAQQKAGEVAETPDLKVFSKPEEDNSLLESYIYDVKNDFPIFKEMGSFQMHGDHKLPYHLEKIPDSVRSFVIRFHNVK
ncbi:hypothetical protein [Vibrio parahaemolyticus]|uniref:hypothetical protein n=1 Tax=Vibrio parahaemolyticus TaxID=670 RepID=UPI000B51D894|nr:hypothetical protein [Vibrio parahaemolyticus]EGQ9176166.1 hypothetical protein [Vibrio parahaemolyticus]EGR0911408.1 hypothetical protein [Vibrio parahaemolyticus]EGR1878470.1 hypothetical protein [Vibrio parahaemolyticus]EGR2251741.1 hypothetical protein [Vibrio parahaemolyticus]EGR5255633.1 hypothetical protein [Vibrio parahaemolyticus]